MISVAYFLLFSPKQRKEFRKKKWKAVGSKVAKGRKRLRAKTVTSDCREESEQSEYAE